MLDPYPNVSADERRCKPVRRTERLIGETLFDQNQVIVE